jgi:CBS domain containing-hemolysin-like protein
METIAGNLPNEAEEIDARHDIAKNPDGSWTANGHMPLEDLVQYIPLPLDDKREYHTIAGLLMENLQHVPEAGEEVKIRRLHRTNAGRESPGRKCRLSIRRRRTMS